MIMETVKLRFDTSNPFGGESAVEVEPVGDGTWVVSEFPYAYIPLLPGDVLEADEDNVITTFVRPTNLGSVSVVAYADPNKDDAMDVATDKEKMAAITGLAERLSPLCRHVRVEAAIIHCTPYNGENVKKISTLPGVLDVSVERYPNGMVHAFPFDRDRGPLMPINMAWIEAYLRMEGGEDVVAQYIPPDEIPDWMDS